MNFRKVQSKYFIGDALPHVWSSVYNYHPQSEETLEKRGEIYAVFSINAPEEFNASTAGNLLVDVFHETYFESKKDSVLESIDSAINAVKDRLTQLMANEAEAETEGIDLNITVLAIRGDEVYFAALGNGKILLLLSEDGDNLLDITAALRDPFGKGFIKQGSSYVQPGQRFLLATKELVDSFEETDLVLSLSSFSDLRFKNNDYENPELVSMFMLGIDLAEEEEIEPLPEEEVFVNVDETVQQEGADQVDQVEEYEQDDLDQVTAVEHANEFNASGVEESELLAPSDKVKIFLDKTWGGLKSLPARFAQIKERKLREGEIKKAQEFREGAVRVQSFEGQSASPDFSNMSTMQALLYRTRRGLQNFKDIVLYDVLKVNHYNWRDFKNNKLLIKLAAMLGVILLVVIIYSTIRSIRKQQELSNQLIEARSQLKAIKEDIDALEVKPAVSSSPIGNLDSREDVLVDISDIEEDFTEKLDILEDKEVDEQKQRLEAIKNKVLLIFNPEMSLVLDAGNSLQAEIGDAVLHNGTIYFTDKSKGKVYALTDSSTPTQIADGLDAPTAITADSNGDLIVFESNNTNDILSIISPANSNKRVVAGVNSSNLAGVVNMSTYDKTNGLYTVSEGSSTVNLLTRSGTSYAPPRARHSDASLGNIEDIEISNGFIVMLVDGKGFYWVDVPSAKAEAFSSVTESIKNADVLGMDGNFSTGYFYIGNNAEKMIYAFTRSRNNTDITNDLLAQISIAGVEGEVVEILGDDNSNKVYVITTRGIYAFSRSSIPNFAS